MKQFGSLWKRDYSLSPRGTATPKSALGAIVTNDRNDLSRVTKCSSRNYKDASREDPLYRGASAMHFNQNSPITEKFGAPVSEYDDVFGGPPKYAFSRPSPVFDETCRMPSRSSPGWKDSDFPVFGTPAPVDGAFVAVSVKASIPDDLNERRKLNSSRLQNNLFAIGIRSRASSRSNSCVQSPLLSASSSFKDCMHDEFLTASVRLRTDCNEDAQSFRETEKVGVMSDTKTLEKESRGDLLGSNENVATVSSGISSEQIFTRNCGRAIPLNSEQNLSKSKDKPNIDPSSPLVQHKYGSTATYSSENFNECLLDEVNTVSMKKVPRVSPAPLYPVSSPRLKNQKSFFRRKLGLEPTEELSIHANSTAKEGILSPSSNFQHSSPAGSGSFARAISQEKSQKQVPGERAFVTSCTHLEVLDRNVVKNRAGKQTNKDYEVFASAIAAIKNTESKLKIFNLARQKEKQKLVAREDKLLEKQAESREDSCSNKETEDAVAKMESSKVQETAESFRTFRSQIKEKQETETRFSQEVLEREEIEALEAVERERKQREKERQKERERQETSASLEIIILEAEEQAAAETWEEFKSVAAQQLKRGSKSIADLSTGGILVAGAVATAGEVAVEKAEIDTLQKLVQNIAVARRTCVYSEETTKQIQVEPRDQQPRNQPDIMKTSLKSDLMEKLGEGIIPVCDAEHASVEEVPDDWLSTPNIEKVEEDAPEEKIASTECTLNHVVRALNERNQRNFELQQGQAEKHTLADLLDGDIKRWATGKEGNIRALLSTLQYVLWPECAWQPVYLTDIIGPTSVKKIYRKAMLIVHPDKIQQKGASLPQKYIAETVFFLLKDAWNRFNSDEIL